MSEHQTALTGEGLPPLRAADLVGWFEAVHGCAPWPWQRRLLEAVLADGRWPAVLDLPTGTGKTATLDIALFALAIDADLPPASRRFGRRIVMIVDRRTVVDQGYARARRIADALEQPTHPVVQAVAARLRALWVHAPAGAPLVTASLRGGMPQEGVWARDPTAPVLALSTVDQVGSRLLFRGYGTTDRMKSVHAGLFGHDTLLLLDEVHLSRPFAQTLTAVARYRGWREVALPDRWQVVKLSATPDPEDRVEGESEHTFGLDAEDLADPGLARRLRAPKPIRLHAGAKSRRELPELLASLAVELGKGGPGRAVGVVCNRVDTAREVYLALEKRAVDRCLLTGRMRPADREVEEARARAACGPDRPAPAEGAKPFVLVATQAIEAGADLDFDGLVTELASLDALRQRLGRLNRTGTRAASAVVVPVLKGLNDTDPIYGDALAPTLDWLRAHADGLDGGPLEFPLPATDHARGLRTPGRDAPVMLPAHVDLWTQTSPVPRPDPEPAPWLHGPDRGEPEVQVVWRADLTADALRSLLPAGEGGGDEGDEEDRSDAPARELQALLEALHTRLAVCPPTSREALSLPIAAVGAWLSGADAPSFGDVEGAGAPEEANPPRGRGRVALRWAGEYAELVATPAEVRPGDVLVVPAEYGGLAGGTWSPGATERVVDVGDLAFSTERGRPVLRLDPAVYGALDLPTPPVDGAAPGAAHPGQDDPAAWVSGWLKDHAAAVKAASGLPVEAFKRARLVTQGGVAGLPPRYVWVGRVPWGRGGAPSNEDDGASFTGVQVGLAEHLAGVGSLARGFAEEAGLPPSLAADVERAARWHDLGKADPRFQILLHGGSRVRAAAADRPLAKSALPATDLATRREAAKKAGLPAGFRHELRSVQMLEAHPSLAAAADPDLVLHLVASHHGFARPFAPIVLDGGAPAASFGGGEAGGFRAPAADPSLHQLDRGVPERFWRLVRRYGWWGLAWLEAVLRLADHRRSELEARGEGGGT